MCIQLDAKFREHKKYVFEPALRLKEKMVLKWLTNPGVE